MSDEFGYTGADLQETTTVDPDADVLPSDPALSTDYADEQRQQQHAADTMNDNLPEPTVVSIGLDTDGDGVADQTLLDTTGSGEFDTRVTDLDPYTQLAERDVDGDGIVDVREISSNDGYSWTALPDDSTLPTEIPDVPEASDSGLPDRSDPDASSPNAPQSEEDPWGLTPADWDSLFPPDKDATDDSAPSTPEPSPSDSSSDPWGTPPPAELPEDPTGVYGVPEAWESTWFYQVDDGACGPTAVAFIVNQFAGAGIYDPAVMVDRAIELGLMTEVSDGMTIPDIQLLLEDQGIPSEVEVSSMGDLAQRLADGQAVVAAIDSGEVWYGEQWEDWTPDHAVVVAGIDTERGVVILADPGDPNGNQSEIPLDLFEDAWADSGFTVVSSIEGQDHLAQDPGADGPAVDSAVGDSRQSPGWAIIPLGIVRSLA